MRIIGGNWKGKKLISPEDDSIRPTSDRTREAVCNILAHRPEIPSLTELVVLDGFCGTGAFALECLSRGAAHAIAIDSAPASLALARRNAALVGAMPEWVQADLAKLPPRRGPAAAIAYLDPPYGKGLAEAALTSLRAQGWLAPEAVVFVEQDAREPALAVEGYEVLDVRRYGRTRISLAVSC